MSRFTKISAAGNALPADVTEFVALLDTTTGLMWSAANLTREGKVELDHAQAMQACLDCNESKLAGFGDWRAPTVEELFMLADRSLVDPAADPVLNMEPDWYWSSTAAAGWPAVAGTRLFQQRRREQLRPLRQRACARGARGQSVIGLLGFSPILRIDSCPNHVSF